MSMELIDRNEMLANILCIACGDKDVSVKWLNEYVGNYPTVKAIPLDRVEQIKAEIESRLQGVNITLEILVKDDALIPRIEAAKTTLENVLEIIDKAIKEQDE